MATHKGNRPGTPPRGSQHVTQEAIISQGDAPFPGGDYSYTVELVASINRELGALAEAVRALKDENSKVSVKLDTIDQRLHAVDKRVSSALVAVSVTGAVLTVIGGIIAFLVNTYISMHPPAAK